MGRPGWMGDLLEPAVARPSRPQSVKLAGGRALTDRGLLTVGRSRLRQLGDPGVGRLLSSLGLPAEAALATGRAVRDVAELILGYERIDHLVNHKAYLVAPGPAAWEALLADLGAVDHGEAPAFGCVKWSPGDGQVVVASYRPGAGPGAGPDEIARAVEACFGRGGSRWGHLAVRLAGLEGGEPPGAHLDHLLDVRDGAGRRSVDLAAAPGLAAASVAGELDEAAALLDVRDAELAKLGRVLTGRQIDRVVAGSVSAGPFLTLYLDGGWPRA